MGATARSGLGLAISVEMPGQAVHPLPPPPGPPWVRKYKSGSNAGHRVQTGGGGASAVSFGPSPADGARVHPGALGKGLFSIQGGGWLLSLSLGKVVGERGAETEGESRRGASPPSPGR